MTQGQLIGWFVAGVGLVLFGIVTTMRQRNGQAEHFLFTPAGERYLRIAFATIGWLLIGVGLARLAGLP